MADDYHAQMAAHQGKVSDDEHKKAGQPVSGSMSDEHKQFVETLMNLVETKKIDPLNAQTFLNQDVYDSIPEEWKDKTDMSLVNIAHQIRQIADFWKSNETPEESPQLETMVEHLWQMKQKIEEHYDVFKF